MTFKKIYIEITNNCNLNCNFCIKNTREKRFMSIDEYNIVLNNIKPFTKYVYLHLMGEPFLHPKINEIIDMTTINNINVNITTNGFLINRVENNKNIRQINISLHSYDEKYKVSFDNYIKNIFNATDRLQKNKTIINYRLWVNSKYYNKFIDELENKYNKKIIINQNGNFQLDNNVYISIKKEFIWPKIKTKREGEESENIGTCLALRDHIGILSNLDVVACCLDSNGDINFGNLNNIPLKEIINSDKFKYIKTNLENNIKTEELCKNCNFYKK